MLAWEAEGETVGKVAVLAQVGAMAQVGAKAEGAKAEVGAKAEEDVVVEAVGGLEEVGVGVMGEGAAHRKMASLEMFLIGLVPEQAQHNHQCNTQFLLPSVVRLLTKTAACIDNVGNNVVLWECVFNK